MLAHANLSLPFWKASNAVPGTLVPHSLGTLFFVLIIIIVTKQNVKWHEREAPFPFVTFGSSPNAKVDQIAKRGKHFILSRRINWNNHKKCGLSVSKGSLRKEGYIFISEKEAWTFRKRTISLSSSVHSFVCIVSLTENWILRNGVCMMETFAGARVPAKSRDPMRCEMSEEKIYMQHGCVNVHWLVIFFI